MGDWRGQPAFSSELSYGAYTAVTGTFSSFVPLVMVRFFFGASEAGAYPNMAGLALVASARTGADARIHLGRLSIRRSACTVAGSADSIGVRLASIIWIFGLVGMAWWRSGGSATTRLNGAE